MSLAQTIALIVCVALAALAFALSLGGLLGYRRIAIDQRERLDRYRHAVDDLDRWCGHEIPQARLIAAHLIAVGEGQNLNAGTPAADEPCTVNGLREQLRRLVPSPQR